MIARRRKGAAFERRVVDALPGDLNRHAVHFDVAAPFDGSLGNVEIECAAVNAEAAGKVGGAHVLEVGAPVHLQVAELDVLEHRKGKAEGGRYRRIDIGNLHIEGADVIQRIVVEPFHRCLGVALGLEVDFRIGDARPQIADDELAVRQCDLVAGGERNMLSGTTKKKR